MEKLKLKIVGLKKSVQSRVMITGIHAVPIYIEQIDDDKYKEKINFILNNVKFGISNRWHETKCFTTASHGSSFLMDRDTDHIFNNHGLFIYDIILDKAHKFLKQLGIKNLKLTLNACGVEKCKNCTELWCSKYTKGMYQAEHNHLDNGEIFSFVYFAKYDPSKDANLVFVKDMSNAIQKGFLVDNSPNTLHEELREHPAFCNHVTLDNIKEGDLVIFPSYLDHFVEEQKHDGPRITIAGNLFKVIDDKKCNEHEYPDVETFFNLLLFLYKMHIKKRVTN